MTREIFRSYDIRGIYPKQINEEIVFKISKALGDYLGKKIAIGHDSRLSSVSLYQSLKKGFGESGQTELIEAGLITTPMLYFIVGKFGLDGGVIVSASHNPKDFNGLKIVGKNAQPISGEKIYELFFRELR